MRLLLLLVILQKIFASDVIWNNGPTNLLREIFKIVEMKNVDDLESAIYQSNSKWLRPSFMQSWHAYSLLDKCKKEELTKLIKSSDLARERPPKLKHYDAVIVMGYSKNRMGKRINYLIKLFNQGIVFDKIYLLGATRNLKISTEVGKSSPSSLSKKNVPIEDLWDKVDKPNLLKKVPFETIKIHKDTSSFGATSEKLLKLAMERYNGNTKGKRILIISDGRSASGRDSLVQKVLEPYEVEIETVWQECTIDDESIESMLRSIAKCLLYMHR